MKPNKELLSKVLNKEITEVLDIKQLSVPGLRVTKILEYKWKYDNKIHSITISDLLIECMRYVTTTYEYGISLNINLLKNNIESSCDVVTDSSGCPSDMCIGDTEFDSVLEMCEKIIKEGKNGKL